MALKIRLARGGTKKRPYYRIVVAENSAPRDGRFVERIGSYNPMIPKDHPERLKLDTERVKYWMSKGAQPTLRIHKMMSQLGLMEAPEIREQPKKSAPGKKRLEREAAEAEAAAAPAEAAPAEVPAEGDTPADAPAEEAKAEDTPAEAPAEAPTETAKAEDAPVEEPKAETAPADAPADAPAEDAPAEETPAEAEDKS